VRVFKFIILSLLTCYCTAHAQYPNNDTQVTPEGIEYYFGIDAFTYEEGGQFDYIISVFNGSNDTIEWTFGCWNYNYDFYLTEQASGDTVWQWSLFKGFSPMVLVIYIDPDSSWTLDGTDVLSNPLVTPPAGEYQLSGRWVPGYTNVTIPSLQLPLTIEPVGVLNQPCNKSGDFSLCAAYPNPFNPTTTISFNLPVAGQVKLEVFDISGRVVGARSPRPYNPGHHSITFDGSNLSSGIYIYRLTAGEFTVNGKMVLLK